MKIEYLGHACFLLTAADGTRLVTDPYEAGGFGGAVAYDAVGVEADVVTVSHDHADHCHVESVRGDPQVIRDAAGGSAGAFNVSGTMTAHDATGGSERGRNIVFAIEADGVRRAPGPLRTSGVCRGQTHASVGASSPDEHGVCVAHLGDLGHALTVDQVKSIGHVDALLTPVGGFYTIDATTAAAVADALGARVIVPMHYKTDKLGFDIAGVQDFLDLQPDRVKRLGSSSCEITAATLPEMPEVWLLDPSR